ncbi:MAG: PEP-CTERM sorting domain-containing protein [Verrucomicrobiales bacterium]
MTKLNKSCRIAALACLFGANASAAIYAPDFTGLGDDQTLHGFGGWLLFPLSGDSSGSPLAYGAEVGGARGFHIGAALDAPSEGNMTAMSGPISGLSLVSSAGYTPTTFSTNFLIVDSSGASVPGGFDERNNYSISLYDGATELFTVSFAAFPHAFETDAGLATDNAWELSFGSSAGISNYTGANWGVYEYDELAGEGLYTFSVTFTDAGSGNVNFSATVAGTFSNTWTGTLAGLGSASITQIRFGSNLGTESAWGDGVMGISGLSIVPEPSSALLVGLAGLGFLRRRRTQA